MSFGLGQCTMGGGKDNASCNDRTGAGIRKGARIHICNSKRLSNEYIFPWETLTLEADSGDKWIRAESFVEMSLHQRLATHLILLERTTRTADIGHLLAATAIERLVAVITVLGNLVDHRSAVVQRSALRAEGALCATHCLATDIGSG